MTWMTAIWTILVLAAFTSGFLLALKLLSNMSSASQSMLQKAQEMESLAERVGDLANRYETTMKVVEKLDKTAANLTAALVRFGVIKQINLEEMTGETIFAPKTVQEKARAGWTGMQDIPMNQSPQTTGKKERSSPDELT